MGLRGRRTLHRRAGTLSLGIIGLLLISSNGLSLPTTSSGGGNSQLTAFNLHIHHIVFLMQENHAFDSLFGEYCQVNGTYCPYTANGIPNGTCVPISPSVPSKGCVAPYNFTMAQLDPPDMPHDWASTHASYDNGSMNGFYAAEHAYGEPFGHYNGTTAPVYWDLAEQYGLGDNFFSASASYSLPNHWYNVAPYAPNVSYGVKTLALATKPTVLHQYLNESNVTPSVEDQLSHSKISWRYYDFKLSSYNWSIQPSARAQAYAYWNPLAARNVSYTARDRPHILARSHFFTDAAAGTLPDVSWLIPNTTDSDHPPMNISTGQSWVASVVDALEASPEWNTTALFITWDEYGGFYDHVAPPYLDSYGDGFRVPLLVVSPWVQQGYIDHTQLDFSSVLHLMETRFGLSCMGPRDCNATLPMGMFSFKGSPRAPIYIPPFGNATYPMPLESSGALPYYAPARSPPLPAGLDSDASADVLDWA